MRTDQVDEAELHVGLDLVLPSELSIGRGTAVFVAGWCFAARPIRSLRFVIDGRLEPVLAQGMPRRDVARAHRAPGGLTSTDSETQTFSDRSGFWGIARVPPSGGAMETELLLQARFAGGGTAVTPLGRIPTAQDRRTGFAPQRAVTDDQPLVAICMATYEAPPELFAQQVESIRRQSHRKWVCLISDDCSGPAGSTTIARIVGDDERFVISRSPRRLGFYHNFERALGMVPAQADFIALADQDDRWHDDKLATLLDEIGEAQLVYSDARIVDERGKLISETYWSRRRPNHSNLLSLLVANSVTGAASLFRGNLLDYALPFPPAQFLHYHDHWIGLTALALGEIGFVERPLYDYVQHRRASLGHAAANRMPGLRDRLSRLRRDPGERVRLWRWHYFVDACRLLQLVAMLELRCGDRMVPSKRRVLRRFAALDDSSLRLTGLALRGGQEILGLRRETLGAEWMLAHAFLWRRMAAASARGARPLLEATPPPQLIPTSDRLQLGGTAPGAVAEKIAPIALAPRDDAPERVNILIPTFDLEHLFGGYIAKFNLARRLAERGARVRIVSVDPVGPLPRDWQRQIESYDGLSGLFARVEVGFGREQGLEVSRRDRFIATTWWTAHIAHSALRTLGGRRFGYLIQEYEPFTFPMGSYAALAEESYALPHFALFSTELLRGYFRRRGIGVYADGETAGDRLSMAFENAITPVDPLPHELLAARETRRLLFYARPEPHAARNMFELGVLALRRAVSDGAFQSGWELNGIGALESGHVLGLGHGADLRLLPRSKQGSYAELLREHDVGLALMYTPHPSLVPIEMASAGMLTVTNSFANKTAEAMASISRNLITTEPTIEAVAAGLAEAVAGTDDVHRRLQHSAVSWSRDWNRSFDDRLLDRFESSFA